MHSIHLFTVSMARYHLLYFDHLPQYHPQIWFLEKIRLFQPLSPARRPCWSIYLCIQWFFLSLLGWPSIRALAIDLPLCKEFLRSGLYSERVFEVSRVASSRMGLPPVPLKWGGGWFKESEVPRLHFTIFFYRVKILSFSAVHRCSNGEWSRGRRLPEHQPDHGRQCHPFGFRGLISNMDASEWTSRCGNICFILKYYCWNSENWCEHYKS